MRNFEKASLGSKGLTIRTSGETRTEQDFCDKEGSDGAGLLLLAGSGVKKLYGTNSTESLLVCAGGLTQFLPLSGVDACHLSHLIVTNNASFSIAGDTLAEETAQSIKEYIWNTRLDQVHPIVPSDLISDFVIINRLITHRNLLYRVNADGSVSAATNLLFESTDLTHSSLFVS